jgi:hypothetical protein
LLDTFDSEHDSAAKTSTATTNGSAKSTNNAGESNKATDWSNVPSEEEQLRLALEDSAWETVPKGKKKKSKTTAEQTEEGTEAVTPQEPAPVKQPSAPKLETKPSQSRYDVLERAADVAHPLDSDWGVVDP